MEAGLHNRVKTEPRSLQRWPSLCQDLAGRRSSSCTSDQFYLYVEVFSHLSLPDVHFELFNMTTIRLSSKSSSSRASGAAWSPTFFCGKTLRNEVSMPFHPHPNPHRATFEKPMQTPSLITGANT